VHKKRRASCKECKALALPSQNPPINPVVHTLMQPMTQPVYQPMEQPLELQRMGLPFPEAMLHITNQPMSQPMAQFLVGRMDVPTENPLVTSV
jgi:hypothetical protein